MYWVCIPFSMYMVTGDQDLNCEIKLSGGLACKVGTARNSNEARCHFRIARQANISQKAPSKCAFGWRSRFLFLLPKGVVRFKSG